MHTASLVKEKMDEMSDCVAHVTYEDAAPTIGRFIK
jgi:hypothetical protein